MKNLRKLTLVLCFMLAFGSVQAATYYTDAYMCTRQTNSVVNLRASPSTSASIVHKLPSRTTVYILLTEPKAADGYTWHIVTTPNGNSGWARGDFVCIKDGRTHRLYR